MDSPLTLNSVEESRSLHLDQISNQSKVKLILGAWCRMWFLV